MVSPQQAEIVKSPRCVLGATCAQGAQSECSKTASTFATPSSGPERLPTDFLSRATKTWTVCFSSAAKEVAKFIYNGLQDSEHFGSQSLLWIAGHELSCGHHQSTSGHCRFSG